jgi:Domain of unknown function (DUF6438)
MKKISLFLLVLIFVSCNKKENNYEKLIIGDWKSFYEIPMPNTNKGNNELPPPPPIHFGDSGFTFYKNGEVEDKLGYFDISKKDENGRIKRRFLGSFTKFKIDNDSLKTFDLVNKKWINIKIFKLTKDSLILEYSDKSKEKFTKQNYKIDSQNSFDKVIVSTSGCFGTCPVNDIMISKTGEIDYYGEMYVNKKGNYKSKISLEDFMKIENNFKKANFINLKDKYTASHTDDMEITTTFIKNGIIIKSISDYGSESPTEMQWATLPIIFLNHKIKLVEKENLKKYIDFGYVRFINGKKVCELTKSESFYLKSLLQKSDESNQNFKPKYIINYWSNDKDKKILSDGQFFKFVNEKGKFITLNLGYNFLERNNLLKRIRDKTEYD